MFLFKKNHQIKPGFTLIEITVALTVFMIFIGIILSSFIHLLSVQVEANRYRKVYSELDNIIALIAADMKDFGLDYECFKTSVCDPNIYNYQTLAFVSADGLERHLFSIEKAENAKGLDVKKLSYSVQKRATRTNEWPAQVYRNLETKNTEFLDFAFTLFPLADPYSEATRAETDELFQPSLTLKVLAKAKAYENDPGIVVQTTISSRQYNLRKF